MYIGFFKLDFPVTGEKMNYFGFKLGNFLLDVKFIQLKKIQLGNLMNAK